MKLINLIFFIKLIFILISSCEPREVGRYLNIFRENKIKEQQLRILVAEYERKVQNLHNKRPGKLENKKVFYKIIKNLIFYSFKTARKLPRISKTKLLLLIP